MKNKTYVPQTLTILNEILYLHVVFYSSPLTAVLGSIKDLYGPTCRDKWRSSRETHPR